MTDSPIITELRKIGLELREAVAMHDNHGDTYVVRHDDANDMRERIDAVILELEQPAASSTAYEMMAASAQAQVEVTETLIELVVATVLAGLIDEEGGGRSNFVISPAAMNDVYRRYDVSAKRIGLGTEIKLKARKHLAESLMEQPAPPIEQHAEQGMDGSEPAEPQAAPHVFDRPLWAARIGGVLFPASDHANADAKAKAAPDDTPAHVENRFCYHDDCPAERCNHTEVASEVS